STAHTIPRVAWPLGYEKDFSSFTHGWMRLSYSGGRVRFQIFLASPEMSLASSYTSRMKTSVIGRFFALNHGPSTSAKFITVTSSSDWQRASSAGVRLT